MARIPRVILLFERSRTFGRQLLSGISHYADLHGPWEFCMELVDYHRFNGQISTQRGLAEYDFNERKNCIEFRRPPG